MTPQQAEKVNELLTRGWKLLDATTPIRPSAPVRMQAPEGGVWLVHTDGRIDPLPSLPSPP